MAPKKVKKTLFDFLAQPVQVKPENIEDSDNATTSYRPAPDPYLKQEIDDAAESYRPAPEQDMSGIDLDRLTEEELEQMNQTGVEQTALALLRDRPAQNQKYWMSVADEPEYNVNDPDHATRAEKARAMRKLPKDYPRYKTAYSRDYLVNNAEDLVIDKPPPKKEMSLAAQKRASFRRGVAIAAKDDRNRVLKDQGDVFGKMTIPVRRGTRYSLGLFGPTASTADKQQLYNRDLFGFSGHGAYQSVGQTYMHGSNQMYLSLPRTRVTLGGTGFSGSGAFWSKLWNGIKSVGRFVAPILGHGAKVVIPMLASAAVSRFAPGAGPAVAEIASQIANPAIDAGLRAIGSGEYETLDSPSRIGDGTLYDELKLIKMVAEHLISDPDGRLLLRKIKNELMGMDPDAVVPSDALTLPASVKRPWEDNTGDYEDERPRKVRRIAAPAEEVEYVSAQQVAPNKETPYGNTQYMMNNLIDPGSRHSRTNPQITTVQDETGDLTFSYREYVKDIVSNTNNFHTVEKFELNPGIAQAFPLLSSFAQYFEEYDFEQLIFHFKSLVTEGYSSAAGSVMVVPIYNPSNSVLPDKRSCENTDQCVSGKVTADLLCGVECDNSKKALGGYLYVRNDDIPREQRRTYDLGFVQVALQGVPADLHIGELWVEYRVRLSKLRVSTNNSILVGTGFLWGGTPVITHFPPHGTATSPAVVANFSSLDVANLVGGSGFSITNTAKSLMFAGVTYNAFSNPNIPLLTGSFVANPALPYLGVTRFQAQLNVTTGQRYRVTLSAPVTQAKGWTNQVLKLIADTAASNTPFSLLVTANGTLPSTVTTTQQIMLADAIRYDAIPANAAALADFSATGSGGLTPSVTCIHSVDIDIPAQSFQQSGMVTATVDFGVTPSFYNGLAVNDFGLMLSGPVSISLTRMSI